MGKDVPAETLVVPPDAELFLTGWLRAALKKRGYTVEVGHVEPADLTFPLARHLIVVRDDGGPQTEAVTFSKSIGVTVLGGTRQNTKATMDLARLTYALVTSAGLRLAEGSPFAAVDKTTSTPPTLINDSADTARAYMNIDYSLVGEFIPG